MRILITGNMGYVGPVLVRHLRSRFPNSNLIGFDTGFFSTALTGGSILPEILLDQQIYGDVRDFNAAHLDGVDAVIHLAAISNDPMGKEFENVTNDVNRSAAVRIAKLSAERGVSRFVFASSCSMYGASQGGPRKETDATNPLTAYARSKIGTEHDLRNVDLGDMIFTSLRFATACGMSDRLRLDLVLNDFVACALTAGEITVLSDGSPWRPLIDVEDMARAIEWAMTRNVDNGGSWLAVNAGSSANNYQVRQLAEAVQRQVPDTRVAINADAPPDNRSYQVDFSLFERLAPDFQSQVDLETSIARLVSGLRSAGFVDRDFRQSPHVRLNMLRHYLSVGMLSPSLRWI